MTAAERTLQSDRLTLRMLCETDLDANAPMCADAEVLCYIGDGQPLVRPMAWRNPTLMVGHWSLRGYGRWAVEERSSGVFVGRIGFWNPEGWPGFELGWMLRRVFWGRGYATAGARAAQQFAFAQMGRPQGISLIHPENAAAVLECLREAFEPYRDQYTPAAFEDTVLTPDTVGGRMAMMDVFVAAPSGGEVVGTVACGVVGDGEGHPRGMAVRPGWQGRGVAEEQLGAAEAELRGAGCGRVSLDTTRHLGRAIRFYEAQCFRASGRVSVFLGMELIEYVKILGSSAMEPTRNDLGQPIGFPLPGWTPPPAPPREMMEGRLCRLEPLDPERHAADLFAANAADADGRSWTYLAYGPFRTLSEYRNWMGVTCLGADPLFFAIIDKADGKPAGVASYLRIAPAAGSIEVGHIHYSPRLQRSPAATEAMYLLMKKAFELGYRRFEWKCDAFNAASRAAAQRLGLSFEGIFRQAAVYKGRSRDTAWFAAIDAEWPALQRAFEAWLAPENFDDAGRQRTRLRDLTGPVLKRRG